MRISNNDLIKLFPHFKEPCVILTAKLSNSSEFDPEDKYAADAIFKCITDIQDRDDKVKIKIFSSVGAIESDKHNILLGGWTELTNYISYMPSYSEKIPHLDLHFYTDPTMENKKVIRKFYGEPKIKSLRAVLDERLGRDKLFYAETGPKGWLTKDYLLVTTFHLKCLMPSADGSLFITSFVGLYGPGTMAVELFFKHFDEKLKESIFKKKENSPCFQTLCSVEKIDHSGKFSYAKDIDFVRTYAITESEPQEFNEIFEGKAKKGKEVKDFIVYLPTSTGIGTEILEISEKKISEKYLQKKSDYSIFIYTRGVFVKTGKELRSVQMDERIYKLLMIFLRQKDMLVPPIPLYRKAWADSPLRITSIRDERDVSPYLKAAISELRTLLKDVLDFEITKARHRGYICKGKFQFCVIIPKLEEKKYILSEAEEEEELSL